MQYKIYTMPHCEKCENIKHFLKEHKISVQEIDLGDDEGVAELRKIYIQIKDKVTRTSDGQLPIPLFISFKDSLVDKVGNSLDDVKTIVQG